MSEYIRKEISYHGVLECEYRKGEKLRILGKGRVIFKSTALTKVSRNVILRTAKRGHWSFWKLSSGKHGWGKTAIEKGQLDIWGTGTKGLEPRFSPFFLRQPERCGQLDYFSLWEDYTSQPQCMAIYLNPPCGRIIRSYPVELRSGHVIGSNQLTNKMWAGRDIYQFPITHSSFPRSWDKNLPNRDCSFHVGPQDNVEMGYSLSKKQIFLVSH